SEPKECPVLDDRTAETTTKEIVRIVRFRDTSLLAEEIVLLGPNGTCLKETRTVKVVGPRFQGRVKNTPARASHLRVVGMHLNFDIFKRFDCWIRRRTIAKIGNRNAVQRVVIAAACAAAERDQRRIGLILLPIELSTTRWNHSRHGYADHECIASRSRQ